MKNLVKMILPVGTFLLASVGAIATSTSNSTNKVADTDGWKRVSMNNCVDKVSCNNIPSTLCKSGAFQAYGKVGLDCIQPLYHTQ